MANPLAYWAASSVTKKRPFYDLDTWMQTQVIVLTGSVSRTAQMALRPQGSDREQGLTHCSDTHAVWEGQSASLVHPISAEKIIV
jgi:hypothetical protein